MHTFQSVVAKLSQFWESKGALIFNPYDVEKGAGTSNPATFLRALGPEPFNVAYIEPCRRPKDGRYGTNPNRFQHYFQYQVILKPSPDNIQELYLESLEAIGLNLKEHDIRFVHDDWENPTLGAWGLGWEIWIDGMECTQFTYFQAIAGVPLNPISGEITYGLERLVMYLQKVDSFVDLKWNDQITYGELYMQNEIEWSRYNFEESDVPLWTRQFNDFKAEAKKLITKNLPIPAYDFVIKSSHAFNMLDARGAISVSERANYIGEIRELARLVAGEYLESRKLQGFPLLKHAPEVVETAKPPHSQSGQKSTHEDLLIEIGCEELPAVFVEIGRLGLESAVRKCLEQHDIKFEAITSYATPRRLAAIVSGVQTKRPQLKQVRRGPSVNHSFDEKGNPLPSALGFFKSLYMEPATLEEIKAHATNIFIQSHQNVDYLFGEMVRPEILTSELLENELPASILGIEFPKSMRWGNHTISFARPIRWIVALLGTETLAFTIGHILSGNTSLGHRQLCPDSFKISSPKEYLEVLKNHFVMADQEERKQSIIAQLEAIEKKESATALYKERVLDQVINLVEWPALTIGTFDEAFLQAPEQVLALEMVEHQKYFPLQGSKGLLPRFVITANNAPTDLIRAGNRKVLSARLSDGRFLWDEDKKIPLEHHAEKNLTTLFFSGLGTIADKTDRIGLIAKLLHIYLPEADLSVVETAASLCKADLATQVVGEFPELQGTMGGLLAKAQGKSDLVALAIVEHWLPKAEAGAVPKTLEGSLIALSDKIDTLLGFFGVGKKPTSSQDPFALRRQAIGIIRILLSLKASVSLNNLFLQALPAMPEAIRKQGAPLVDELVSFISQRARGLFIDEGFKKEEVEAVLSRQPNNPVDSHARIRALHDVAFKDSQSFCQLLEVFRRCQGQLGASNVDLSKLVANESLLVTPEEQLVLETLKGIEPLAQSAFQSQQYSAFIEAVSKLKEPLDDLFAQVKILTDDDTLKNARLSMLNRIFELFNQFADVKVLYGLLPKKK